MTTSQTGDVKITLTPRKLWLECHFSGTTHKVWHVLYSSFRGSKKLKYSFFALANNAPISCNHINKLKKKNSLCKHQAHTAQREVSVKVFYACQLKGQIDMLFIWDDVF